MNIENDQGKGKGAANEAISETPILRKRASEEVVLMEEEEEL